MLDAYYDVTGKVPLLVVTGPMKLLEKHTRLQLPFEPHNHECADKRGPYVFGETAKGYHLSYLCFSVDDCVDRGTSKGLISLLEEEMEEPINYTGVITARTSASADRSA
jgi:hypothetical protein